MELPVYILTLDENSEGFNFASLVKRPAIEIEGYNGTFVAFGENVAVQFKVTNEDKRIISGPLLLADVPIYRKDPKTGEEYLAVVSGESTPLILQKLFKDSKTKNVNVNHKTPIDEVYMFEAFLIDRNRMPPPTGYETLTDGSIFVSYKVENDAIWQQVKAGDYRGFSFEGYLTAEKEDMMEAAILEAFSDEIAQ